MDEENRLVVCSAIADELFSVVPPVSGVQPSAELHTQFEGVDLLDIILKPASQGVDETRFERANRVRRFCNVGDYILRAGRAFDICKEEYPSFGFQPAAEFMGNTGLAHAPLTGQQYVVALADSRFQYLQLGFVVEKVGAIHPASSRYLHRSTSLFVHFIKIQYATDLLSTDELTIIFQQM